MAAQPLLLAIAMAWPGPCNTCAADGLCTAVFCSVNAAIPATTDIVRHKLPRSRRTHRKGHR